MLDISHLLGSLLQLWWLLPIIIIILFIKSPIGKGFIGETLLNLAIKIRLDKKKYHLLHDITLKTEGGTTQIDHIIISKYGVFVIETKNMKGWIFGSEHQRYWTQNIYGKKHTFQNPLHQNYKHTKTLEKLLDIDGSKIFSVVVFVGDATFKSNMPDNVVYPRGLFRFIDTQKSMLFTEKEMWCIIDGIEDGRLSRSFNTHKEHVNNIKTKVHENETKSDMLICPKCNNNLVLRVTKRGKNIGSKFYGCKNYPKCNFTRNI